MSESNLIISGLTRAYPEFKYNTEEMIEALGNKLSEDVKENIYQLGVKNRYFVRPFDRYISKSSERIKSNADGEPISDLCVKVAEKCLSDLNLKKSDITCIVAAYEDSDFLSPGLSSILLTKLGLSKFIPHFNIQGMACSTLPKLLELGKNFVHNSSDKILFVISGCNSGWYLPHLKDNQTVRNPKEISNDQYDKNKQISKWVSTMFSFLFGDGVAAFVMSMDELQTTGVKVSKITHAVNFDELDYRKACVRLVGNSANHMYEYELTAGSDILKRSLEYSKKVLNVSLGNDIENFDEKLVEKFMTKQNKVMIHTGSLKILEGFQNLYKLDNNQIKESFDTLKEYGNLTGVSIPTVLEKAMFDNNSISGKGLLIGITMGFGLDIVEVEKI
jgi:predicted naringenin-chalcone synthase|tara:strand:+ start:3780 stop:4946 length:1167 start_codon:yes stop_codon:yes gene_type:complete